MKHMKRLWLVVLLIGTVSLIQPAVAADKIAVTTTTTMVTDMVKAVGGDRVEVTGLMGPGVDPHLYKSGAKDITHLSQAKLIFYSGLMLEGRMADLFSKMARRGKKVYAITESIPEAELLEPESFAGHWDPHVWGNPKLWAKCVDTVVTALTENDPDGKAGYAERGAAVKIEYQELFEWAKKRAAELPQTNRVLITSHDAFNYFGLAFGFEVVGVQGISTVSEAGLADITRIVDFIKEKKVKAIFVESSVSPATIERISQDAGVSIGGELFSDALGTPGKVQTIGSLTYDEGTYKGWIGHNINTVVDALK
jgi:manganese/zinc/iron transport system substrate-binding protein